MKKITIIPETITDIPNRVALERKVDFHARLPISLCDKLEKASKDKGILRNDILKMALEAFLGDKK